MIFAGGARAARLCRWVYEGEAVTRGDLERFSGRGKVTIAREVEALFRERVLEERGMAEVTAGRRPAILKLRSDLFYGLGVYIRSEKLRAALSDAAGNKVGEQVRSFARGTTASEIIELIQDARGRLEKDAGISADAVVGAVICLPGILDSKRGEVISSSAFRADRDLPLATSLGERWGIPVTLINDAKLLALQEKARGDARDMDHFLYFTCGYGLGVFMNGQLYEGHQGNAGEVGFMRIGDRGPRDIDGRTGTLFGLAPFYSGVLNAIEDIIRRGGNTKISDYLAESGGPIDFEMVLKAIEAGDKLCSRLVADYFEKIAEAAINLAYVFNPEAIFLDEWTARCPRESVEIVQRLMEHYGAHNWRLSVRVASAKFGKEHLAGHAARVAGSRFLSGLETGNGSDKKSKNKKGITVA